MVMSEEMVMQILLRTSPKSLLRFKCIHKLWYSIINDPLFAVKHLQLYNNNRSNINSTLLVRCPNKDALSHYRYGDDITGYVLSRFRVDYDTDEELNFVDDEDLIHPPFDMGECIIINHCDGIMFIMLKHAGDTILYNPTIKEIKTIPAPCYRRDSYCRSWAAGFGYDAKNGDYIIVDIVQLDSTNNLMHAPKTAVYTLGIDAWREIENDELQTEETYFLPYSFDLYSKGVFFWLGHEEEKVIFASQWDLKQVVILFDTGDDLFHVAMLPGSFERSLHGILNDAHVATLDDDKIALYGFYLDDCETMDIWVTNDADIRRGGGIDCWTKYLSLVPVDVYVKSLALWKIDEVLILAKDGRVVLFNLVTGNLKYFPIYVVAPSQHIWELVDIHYIAGYVQTIFCLYSMISLKGK